MGKVQTPSEALKNPLITAPLASAEPDQTLRQQSKTTLRRLLYEKSDSVVKKTPDGADWLMESPETMRKWCLSTKFPHQEIR